MKSPGIKARSGRLPAPLQAVASSVRLHDPPAEAPPPPELPETPPHASQVTAPHTGDHSIFAPILIGMFIQLIKCKLMTLTTMCSRLRI